MKEESFVAVAVLLEKIKLPKTAIKILFTFLHRGGSAELAGRKIIFCVACKFTPYKV